MEKFDFMQARKELQEQLKESYIVRINLTDKKHLEIRSTIGIIDMECIDYVYKFCAQHNLKYYVYIASAASPTFDIFQ